MTVKAPLHQQAVDAREVTLAQVFAYIDDCAAQLDRVSLLDIQGAATQALQRLEAAQQPVPAASSNIAATAQALQEFLLHALVERTGYPADMLEPQLDLDADLGIDTVKQVEAFALAREHFKIPKDPNFRVREHNTLAKLVAYLSARVDAEAIQHGTRQMPVVVAMGAGTASHGSHSRLACRSRGTRVGGLDPKCHLACRLLVGSLAYRAYATAFDFGQR